MILHLTPRIQGVPPPQGGSDEADQMVKNLRDLLIK